MKLKLFLLIVALHFVFQPKTALAVVNTDVSSCVNPQGSVLADHESGTHGIVNSSETYTGSDKVYLQNNGNVVQCYCNNDGSGIQTNWIKNTGFSESERSILKNQGYISIPDGSLWGLSSGEYFAKNESFSCKGSNGNSGSNDSKVGGASATSNGSSSPLSTFANTGNSLLFYSTLVLGLGSLAYGVFAPKKRKTSVK